MQLPWEDAPGIAPGDRGGDVAHGLRFRLQERLAARIAAVQFAQSGRVDITGHDDRDGNAERRQGLAKRVADGDGGALAGAVKRCAGHEYK